MMSIAGEADVIDIGTCLQNREISWLMFNMRVLEQANDAEMPLFERLKFISIFTTNLDEFYMVRVGSLADSAQFTPNMRENKTGMTALEQLAQIYKHALPLYALREQYYPFIMNLLGEYGIEHCAIADLDKSVLKELRDYFTTSVMPFLSAQIIDSRHPFPHIANKQPRAPVQTGRIPHSGRGKRQRSGRADGAARAL